MGTTAEMYTKIKIVKFLVGRCSVDSICRTFLLAFPGGNLIGSSSDPRIVVTSSSDVNVSVTLSSPKMAYVESAVILPRSQYVFSVPGNLTLVGGIESKGIFVETSGDVSIYGIDMNSSSVTTEAFISFPIRGLGIEYYVVSSIGPSVLLIAAHSDNTFVEVTLPLGTTTTLTLNSETIVAGNSLSFNLNQYQTAYMRGSGDISGTMVTATNLIAVFSGNILRSVNTTQSLLSEGYMMAQIPAVNSLGTRYITVPTPTEGVQDILKMVATKDNTSITLYGADFTDSMVLEAGQSISVNLTNGTFYSVHSSYPILAAQFTAFAANPAMKVLVSTDNLRHSYDLSLFNDGVETFNHSLTLISEKETLENLYLDGKMVDLSGWKDVPGTNPVMAGYSVTVTGGYQMVEHRLFGAVAAYVHTTVQKAAGVLGAFSYPAGMCLTLTEIVSTTIFFHNSVSLEWFLMISLLLQPTTTTQQTTTSGVMSTTFTVQAQLVTTTVPAQQATSKETTAAQPSPTTRTTQGAAVTTRTTQGAATTTLRATLPPGITPSARKYLSFVCHVKHQTAMKLLEKDVLCEAPEGPYEIFSHLFSSSHCLFSGSRSFFSSSHNLFSGSGNIFNCSHNLFSGTHNLFSCSQRLFSGFHRLFSGFHHLFSGSHHLFSGSHHLFIGSHRLFNGPNLTFSCSRCSLS